MLLSFNLIYNLENVLKTTQKMKSISMNFWCSAYLGFYFISRIFSCQWVSSLRNKTNSMTLFIIKLEIVLKYLGYTSFNAFSCSLFLHGISNKCDILSHVVKVYFLFILFFQQCPTHQSKQFQLNYSIKAGGVNEHFMLAFKFG